MKKNILVLVSMAIILIIVIAGCDLVGGNSFSFHNGSDHDVTVTPDGQTSWEKFTLDPDEEHKVVIPETVILFTYSPADTTGYTEDPNGTFRFSNHYTYIFSNDSDYNLAIVPYEQDSWEDFTLSAGSSRTISIPESTISYSYNYAGLININHTQAGKIRFYNKTLLAIDNSSSVDIELVEWNGYYFGLDDIWDSTLNDYVHGIKSGNGYYQEVSAGTDYISFWFPSGGPQYRTVSYITVYSEEQLVFTFYDSTTIMERSLNNLSESIDEAYPVYGATREESVSNAEQSAVESVLGIPFD